MERSTVLLWDLKVYTVYFRLKVHFLRNILYNLGLFGYRIQNIQKSESPKVSFRDLNIRSTTKDINRYS